MPTSSFKAIRKWSIVTLLVAIPVTLWVLPANFFDNGQSICLSVLLLDTTCPGCGITRGIMHLMHFDFTTAWEFNKLSFVLLPVFFLYWLKLLLREFDILILKWLKLF